MEQNNNSQTKTQQRNKQAQTTIWVSCSVSECLVGVQRQKVTK